MWVFAQKSSADFARDQFVTQGKGRERIDVQDVPRVGAVK
jgi:hypothetical protein